MYQGVNTRDDKFVPSEEWQTVQTVYSSGSNIFPRTFASCDKLFAFYQVPVPGIFINLKWKSRDISGTTWSNEGELNYSVSPYQENVPYLTQTSDGNMHITYDSEEIIHRKYTCSTSSWSDEYSVYGYMCMTQSMTSTSNDLYVAFRKYTGDPHI